MRRRVVITGLGVVASCGIGREAFWDSVSNGRSGIDWIQGFDTSDLYCKIAGEILNFKAEDYMKPREARRAGAFAHYAVAAARLAVTDSGMDLSREDRYRLGAVMSTSTAGAGEHSPALYSTFEQEGAKAVEMTHPTQVLAHSATSHVCIELGLKGPNSTCSVACVGSLDAVASASNSLRTGQADMMLAGGTEACVTPFGMGVLCRQRVFTSYNDPPQAACRPYDGTRDGIVVSDGAGVVMLETAAHALERGAKIYGEVVGHSCTTEAYHLLASTMTGVELAHALQQALLQAKLSPLDLDYLCAHGVGSMPYDIAETNAFKLALGDRAYNIPVSSIKSTTGQPFSPGGAWQLISSCMTLETGLVPPTINYQVPDPECDLDYVPNWARRARVDTISINAHGFGGTHGVVLVRRFVA
jgi:3-oxoacyl-[acyl-carrier-protein] synthase II